MLAVGAALPAAGEAPVPLLRLGGTALVALAVRALLDGGVDELVVVAPPGASPEVRAVLAPVLRAGIGSVVEGSRSRHESLHRGLSALGPAPGIVVVHDACRPLAPAELVGRVVEAVRSGADAAVPVLEVTETVKELDAAGWIVGTVPRETLVQVQAPRAVRRDVLAAAHQACPPGRDGDAVPLAGEGARTVAVPGHQDAFPVLGATDLALVAAVLAGRGPASR